MMSRSRKAFSFLAILTSIAAAPVTYGAGVGIAPPRKAKPQTEAQPLIQTRVLVQTRKAQPPVQTEVQAQPAVQTEVQAQAPVQGQRVGLWIQNGIQDAGHIEWVERSTCKPVALKEPFFLVTDFWSSKDQSNYETLRSSGLYKRDGSNIASYLPKGSLVSLLGSATKEYERVFVISVADVAADAKAPKLSAQRDLGFVHRKSLNDLTDYVISFGPSRSVETAKIQGMDLAGKTLKALQNKKEEYIAANCAIRGTHITYMLFHTDQGKETSDQEDLLGLTHIYPKLLDTATAYPDENDDQDVSEDNVAQTKGEATEVVLSTAVTKPAETKPMKTKPSDTKPADTKPADKPAETNVGGVPVVKGTAEEVVCMDDGQVTVREAAKKAGEVKESSYFFISRSGTAVKRVQDFEGQTRSRKGISYIKIEVVGKSAPKNVGWVAVQYVKNKALCKNATADTDTDADADANGGEPETPAVTSSGHIFPLMSPADQRYSKGNGARWWGAGRPGRRHAGCDLFRPTGNRVRTVGAGKLIRGPYEFYCRGKKKCKGKGPKSYAVEQQLDNGQVIRYGEIGYAGAIKADKKNHIGKDVTVGKIGFPRMLHFELYSGKANPDLGLTDRTSKKGFQRRWDLMDPTQFLLNLEKQTFGGAK